MQFLVGLICALALGAVPVAGCSDSDDAGGSGGNGGAGGAGGSSGTGGSGGSEPACEGTVCGCTETGIRAAVAQGGGPFTFDCAEPTTVVTSKRIEIDRDVILDGQKNLTIDGNNDHLVVSVLPGVTAELRGFRVTRGWAGFGNAGGIVNHGILTVVDSEVFANQAFIDCTGPCAGGSGGGIYNSHRGTLVILNSVVSGNTAEVTGGGFDNGGSLTITRSTVSGNTAGDGVGGGILNSTAGQLAIHSSLVSGNSARRGGGIYNSAAMTMVNSTVSNNSANDEGGGILSEQFGPPDFLIASLTMIGNTVADNDAPTGAAVCLTHPDATVLRNLVEGDCANDGSALGSSGYNIESPGDTCGFGQATDQVGVSADDLKLGPLQNNGGPTETHALLPGSIAIDQTPAEDCVDADGQPLTTDQRGEPRPAGDGCDVGAFEVQGSN